jgi:hypothetical protein
MLFVDAVKAGVIGIAEALGHKGRRCAEGNLALGKGHPFLEDVLLWRCAEPRGKQVADGRGGAGKRHGNTGNADIAAKVGKSEASISGTMRLLNLPEDVKKTVAKEKLPEGVVKPLVAQDEATIKKVLPKIISEGWSVRKVERYFATTKPKSSAAAIKKYQFHKEEDALGAKYGATVAITTHSITFRCKTEAEIKALIAKLSNK